MSLPKNLRKPTGEDLEREEKWLKDRKKHYAKIDKEKLEKRRINPFARTIGDLVAAEASGKLSPEAKAKVIELAKYYAFRNDLPFDGTFTDAMRLAGGADKTVRLHVEAQARLN